MFDEYIPSELEEVINKQYQKRTTMTNYIQY